MFVYYESNYFVLSSQAKVSYLTQKCKEKDATLQAVAMDIKRTNPKKADQLLSEISALQSPLPRESTNQPLSTERRIRRHRGSNRSNRTLLDPVREEESGYSDIGQDENTSRRGQRSARPRRVGSHVPSSSVLDDLDIAGDVDLGGDLDLGEISVKDLIDQTSRTSGRYSARYNEEDEDDQLLSSLLDLSVSRRQPDRHGDVGVREGILAGLRSSEDAANGIDSDINRTPQQRRHPRRRKHKAPVRYFLK